MLDCRVFFKCEWFVLQGCLHHDLRALRANRQCMKTYTLSEAGRRAWLRALSGWIIKYQTPVRSILVEPPEGSVEAKVPKIILQVI